MKSVKKQVLLHVVGSVLALAIFAIQPLLNAQILGARVQGVVHDSSNAVIAGATVTASNVETGINRNATTDAQGHYGFNDLPPGKYDVSGSMTGFKTTVRQGVTLATAGELAVDLTLEVGGVAEQVTVTGEAPQVETQNGTISGVVEEKNIRDLPLNGRSFSNLAQLEPGVVITRAATNTADTSGFGDKMSLGGARPQQMSFTLDGADLMGKDNSTPSGVSGYMLGVDTIQEFRVSTSSFSAEFGRNSGGVISAISKSGTNQFHGTGFEFLRNSAMDARNFFDYKQSPDDRRLPAFRRNQFGGTFGGPIQKDKTFAFGGFEGFRQTLGVSGVATVPTKDARLENVAASVQPYLALYPLPNGDILPGNQLGHYNWTAPQSTKQNDFTIRLDHQISSSDSIMGRVFFDDSYFGNPSNPGIGLTSVVDKQRIQSYVAGYKKIFGASTVNDFRMTFNRQSLNGLDNIPKSLDALEFVPGRGFGNLTQSSGITTIGAGTTNPRFWDQNTFQYIDDMVIAHGRHTFKLGAMIERFQMNEFSVARYRGQYIFANLDDFKNARPQSFQVGFASSGTRGLRQWLVGTYFQDDFKVSPRLTFNIGLRYEFTRPPTEAAGRMATLRYPSDSQVTIGDPWWKNPTYKNFAPRFGFAYDLTGDGKTAIRGGYGIFFDQLLPIYWRDANSRTLPYQVRYVLNPPQGEVLPFPYAARTVNPAPALSGAGIELDLAAPYADTHSPYTQQYNLSIQRQLTPTMSVLLGYMGSTSKHNSRNVNMNSCLPSSYVNGNDPVFAVGCPVRNPNFGILFQHLFDGVANYNSMQASLKKRFSHGLNFDFVYQYAKTMDSISGIAGSTDFGNVTSFSMDPENARRDYGRAAFDIRHYAVVNATYELPYKGKGILGQALGGWSMSSLASISSGEPFTVENAFERSGARVQVFGNQERPNLAPGGNSNPISGTTAGCGPIDPKTGKPTITAGPLGNSDRWFDPCQFSLQSAGRFGNLGRDTVQGPNLITVDLSFKKNFAIGEKNKLEFRWETFNLLNHANFGVPAFTVFTNAAGAINPNAGKITTTRTQSRQMQLALKFVF